MHPTLFDVGGFKIASFGMMMVVAFLSSLALLRHRVTKFGISADSANDVAFYSIIFGILGARILFILQDLPHYLANTKELFAIQFQGLTSFGGFIVGGLTSYIVCKKKKINASIFLDAVGVSFLLGHAIGRIGCLLNGCCHGKVCETAFPFAAYSSENRMLNVPAQLYDSAMNVGVLLIILALAKRFKKPGTMLGAVLVGHGFTRFVYEFARAGASSTTIGGSPLTEAHVMALAVMLFGGIVWLVSAKREVTA